MLSPRCGGGGWWIFFFFNEIILLFSKSNNEQTTKKPFNLLIKIQNVIITLTDIDSGFKKKIQLTIQRTFCKNDRWTILFLFFSPRYEIIPPLTHLYIYIYVYGRLFYFIFFKLFFLFLFFHGNHNRIRISNGFMPFSSSSWIYFR